MPRLPTTPKHGPGVVALGDMVKYHSTTGTRHTNIEGYGPAQGPDPPRGDPGSRRATVPKHVNQGALPARDPDAIIYDRIIQNATNVFPMINNGPNGIEQNSIESAGISRANRPGSAVIDSLPCKQGVK
ncbi:MAG: hypothetical protein GDA36_01305 [Rhodobacteraceae bacterium]|nr:hypothetical protein [Paracoccaceae bacterium]